MPFIRQHGFHPRIRKNPTLLAAGVTGWTVYCLWDGEACKVGRTKGHPASRLASLSTGNPRRLQLLAWTTTLTERQAHSRLWSERVRGEWFKLSEKLLAEVSGWDWLDTALHRTLTRAAEQKAFLLSAFGAEAEAPAS